MEKKLQPMKNKLLLFFFLLCVLPKLYSQTVAGDYTFSYDSGTYSDIGGNNILGISDNWDNFDPQSVSLGFSFYFNGNSYTSCFVNPNGYITFGTQRSTGTNFNPISSDEGFSGAISGFGRDLRYGANDNASRIRYLTSGTAPNRIFTVQWKNARRVGDDNGFVNFQIRLYEGSNKIEVAYGTSTNVSSTNYPVQVGLRGASNADFNNRTTTTNWAASTAGAANNATNNVTSSVKPVPNSIYRWSLTTISGTIPLTVNGIYTVPCGVTSLTVETWGGGGAGSLATNPGAFGGGGGGAYAKKDLVVTAGDSFTYNIGTGGQSGQSNRNGGDTWFGSTSTVMAKGGTGVANNTATGGIGGQATASVGDIRYSGGNGATGSGNSGGGGGAAMTNSNGNNGTIINGGTSVAPGGNGGNGESATWGAGDNGKNYGGGGGGGKAWLGWIDQYGGNGAQGHIRLSYSYPNPGTPPPITAITAVSSDPTDDIGCTSNEVTLQATGGNTGAGVSTLWYQGSTCPSFAYIQEFMGPTYTTTQTTVGTVTNGNRTFTATNNDPNIDMQNVLTSAINPALYKYIVIRYRVVFGGGGTAQIYFKKNNSDLSEANSVSQALLNDGQWHIMTINMSDSTEWHNTGGNITGWRFDYASVPGTIMEIDYLALSSVPILENTNADDTLINVITTAENTTFGSLRIADQAALCNGAIPYTTCIPAMIHRSDRTFTATTGDWDVATNWNFSGVPNSSNCVFINDNRWVHVNTPSAVAKTIRVSPLGKVNISANNALTVTNAIINQGNGGNFVVESDGNLLQINDAAVNSGNIIVKRDSKMKRLDYTYWGTPVEGQTLKTFSPNTVTNRFYSYNEADDSFSIITPLTNPMVKGQGYVIRAPNNFTTSLQTWPATFTGKPHNGTVDVTVTKLGAGKNLVGNPYPSNIDLVQLTANNSSVLTGTYYFWTNNATWTSNTGGIGTIGNYNGNGYAVWNGSGGVQATNSAGDLVGQVPTRYVKPGQGFLAEASKAGTVSFKNGIRTKDGGASPFFNRGTSDQKSEEAVSRFWLTLTTPVQTVSTVLVAYVQGATNAYDPGFDAVFPSEVSDRFFTLSNDREFLIQGRQFPLTVTDVVSLGMSHYADGNYTIALAGREGVFANGQKVYLRDKATGTVTNLSEGSYTYSAVHGISRERFEIIYEPQTVLAADGTSKENIQVYRDGSDFVVKSPGKKITAIEVYDTSGKLIAKSDANQTEVRMDGTHWVNGVYVLKINRNGELIMRKIVR